ncbi:MAG: DUF3368 domain-containing protein [Flavobacteriales bacterium]|nr:DUF3368 domain-containing protein [Flavobacteriales bacterium]
MPKVVITDTSSLILLHKIEQLRILNDVYGIVYTTIEVANEFGEPLPDWIHIEAAKDRKYQQFLETQLDLGEASAIALAQEMNDSLLILDDLKARKLAKQLGLHFTGTLGVIHKAKQMGKIPLVKPIIEKLLKTDFRISEQVVKEILKRNGE